jgi:hypothetical protein
MISNLSLKERVKLICLNNLHKKRKEGEQLNECEIQAITSIDEEDSGKFLCWQILLSDIGYYDMVATMLYYKLKDISVIRYLKSFLPNDNLLNLDLNDYYQNLYFVFKDLLLSIEIILFLNFITDSIYDEKYDLVSINLFTELLNGNDSHPLPNSSLQVVYENSKSEIHNELKSFSEMIGEYLSGAGIFYKKEIINGIEWIEDKIEVYFIETGKVNKLDH